MTGDCSDEQRWHPSFQTGLPRLLLCCDLIGRFRLLRSSPRAELHSGTIRNLSKRTVCLYSDLTPHQGAADLRDVQPRGAQGLGERPFTSAPLRTVGLQAPFQIRSRRSPGGAIVIAAETVLVLVLGSRHQEMLHFQNFEVTTVATLPYRLEHGGARNSVAYAQDAVICRVHLPLSVLCSVDRSGLCS